MKHAILLLPLLGFLASCQSVPTAPPVVQCPRVQPIQWDAPEPAFTGRMGFFLQGKLPELIDYGLTSKPAAPRMTAP